LADVSDPERLGFAMRQSLEDLGIGYGRESSQPGRFYEYPGDPLASGVGTPVTHTAPA
jgi:hypothetical protein